MVNPTDIGDDVHALGTTGYAVFDFDRTIVTVDTGEEEGEGNLGTWRHQDEKGKRGAKSVVVTAPKPKKKKKPAKAKPVAAPKSGMAVPKINDPEGKPSVVLEAPPDK